LSEQTPNYDIIVAIIALVTSVITAVVSSFFIKKNEVKLDQLRNDLAIKRAELDARRNYEYEAKKRLYQECEPVLFQLHQLCEAAQKRISHMPRRIEPHFFSKEKYLEENKKYLESLKDSLKKPEEKSPTRQKEEGALKDKLGWLSFPNYYMLSTIYHLLAPMATFKILQDRLTTVDLQSDPFIKRIYLLSKHLYLTFSSDTDLAETAGIQYDTYDQGIFAGYLDNATEALIEYPNESNKVSRIKSFGEFNRQYVSEDNSTTINGKKVKLPFDKIYDLLEFFHPRTKPVLWRILIEQLYLYNAIIDVYILKEKHNYKDPTEKLIEKLDNNKPIKRLPENQLKDFKDIPKDQLNDSDHTEQWFRDVENHLLSRPELKNLIEIKSNPVSE
jgi:hypothetical protein